MNLLCKFLVIGMLGIVSAYASGYEEYLKELDELKAISIDARAKKPEIQLKFKGDYNELARDVNKYIDYFILVVDEKIPFNFSEIDTITKSINLKVEKLKNRVKDIDRTTAYDSAIPYVTLAILTIKAARDAYDFFKELRNDYEKYQIKKELISYKWEKIK